MLANFVKMSDSEVINKEKSEELGNNIYTNEVSTPSTCENVGGGGGTQRDNHFH